MGGPNWAEQLTAWSTLAYVVLTAMLAAAASGAAYFTFRQMGAAEGQLREARKAREGALRPEVVISRATRLGTTLWLTFRNVGPGPALSVRCAVWILGLDVEPTSVEQLELLNAKGAGLASSGQPPTSQFRIGSLGSNEERLMPTEDVPFAGAALFAVTGVVHFEDVFGNTFPQAGGFAGSTLAVEDETPTVTVG